MNVEKALGCITVKKEGSFFVAFSSEENEFGAWVTLWELTCTGGTDVTLCRYLIYYHIVSRKLVCNYLFCADDR